MPYPRERKCHTRMAINAWSDKSIQVRIIRFDSIFHRNFRTIFEAENTIRGQHGITDTRNCGHGSGIGMKDLFFHSEKCLFFLDRFN